MVILGIDPGYERVGWGVVRKEGSRLTCLGHGLVSTPRIAMPDRLAIIHDDVSALIELWKPDAMATERQIFAANRTTALDVAKALGILVFLTAKYGLDWNEYTPAEVKLGVAGVGNADKKQVTFMVRRLLALQADPKPDDVADALAIAVTHALRAPLAGAVSAGSLPAGLRVG